MNAKSDGGFDEVILKGEGVRLPVRVYRPAAKGPAAAVVVCPGGVAKGNFEVMAWVAERLQAEGFLALIMSWRDGSPLRDPEDVGLALDWLQADPGVDGDRLAVMGISRGGGAALRAAAAHPDRLKVVITFGPVTNLLQQAEGTAVYAPTRHQMLVDWLGDPVKDRAFYETVQAITYGDRIKQPLLMLHGGHDMHAPIEQSLWMKAAIEAGGNSDIQLEIIPLMGHYGDMMPSRYGFDILGDLITAFLKKRLV